MTPLTDPVFADTSRWLEITVDGTTLPRVRFVTGPYAHRVSTVDGASGGTITSKVSIGPGHINSGNHGFVAGAFNTVNAEFAAIPGGTYNYATGVGAVVGGGVNNRARGSYSVVGGGGADGVDSNAANGNWSTVSGGLRNQTTGIYAAISGGLANKSGSLAAYSTIGGGGFNSSDAAFGTVGGGWFNIANGFYSTIGGGSANRTYGYGAVVAGGGSGIPADSNVARGNYSMVLGGTRNVANGNWSLAAGHRARSLHTASFVWADSTSADFASTGPSQFLIRARGGVGIGTNQPQTATGGQVLHILNPVGSSVLRLDDGEFNGIQWEIQSTVYGGIGTLNLSNITAFTNPFQFYGSGDFHASGVICAANHACPSDERLKEDIHPLSGALAGISQLQGVTYCWNAEARREQSLPADRQVGLLAQNVQKIIPQAVSEQPDGYLAVDYARLVPLLIEAIKEQQGQIESLKRRLEQITQ
ncbi:MAG TPA: tail fiber domain-containing protein [bacterium]|nr:tail fiber domain-containing protein [bacterium]